VSTGRPLYRTLFDFWLKMFGFARAEGRRHRAVMQVGADGGVPAPSLALGALASTVLVAIAKPGSVPTTLLPLP